MRTQRRLRTRRQCVAPHVLAQLRHRHRPASTSEQRSEHGPLAAAAKHEALTTGVAYLQGTQDQKPHACSALLSDGDDALTHG